TSRKQIHRLHSDRCSNKVNVELCYLHSTCLSCQFFPKTKLQDRDLPAEVRALELYLNRTGGSCGGWDQYDHQAFLKVWTKFHGQPAYQADAKLYLPCKTEEEIEQHEEWYKELIHLQDKKREVNDWEMPHTMFIKCLIISCNTFRPSKGGKPQSKWPRGRKVIYLLEQILVSIFFILFQEERRRQLEVKLIIEEQLRLKREEEEEEQRRKREDEMRELEERRKEATKGIKKFNERVDGQVSRDPSRLTRPTKGWEERMKNIGPSGEGPLLHMFHRAVPTWRQGL
uniref:Uncharacterized protein n=1 Tax=Neogobius melanostomus TaxID=47308 RepID=A0A8C6SVH4_9GOBI